MTVAALADAPAVVGELRPHLMRPGWQGRVGRDRVAPGAGEVVGVAQAAFSAVMACDLFLNSWHLPNCAVEYPFSRSMSASGAHVLGRSEL